MTVASNTDRVAASGNGVTTVFSTNPMVFFDADSLLVTLVEADGDEVVQALTTNYTVTGGEGEDGSVTMITAPASGETLVIERVEPNVQGLDLEFQSRIPSPSLERTLDKIVMQIQRIVASFDFPLNALRTIYNAGSRKISNLASGTEAGDAVNKGQLDAVVIASGNVPAPVSGTEDNYMLQAQSGAFSWRAPENIRVGLETPKTVGKKTTTNADLVVLESDRGKTLRFITGASDRSATVPSRSEFQLGDRLHFIKEDETAGKVQISFDGAEDANGLSEIHLARAGDGVMLKANDSEWDIVSLNLAPLTTVVSASGTHTFTPGRRRAVYEAVGPGGGSGGTEATGAGENACSGCGGAGEYFRGEAAITTASVAITLGAAGTAGAAGNNNGGDGGLTTIAGIATVDGGGGGDGGAASNATSVPAGGAGGTGGSDIATFFSSRRQDGGEGSRGAVAAGSRVLTGLGGLSPLGAQVATQNNVAGLTPSGFGGGASGSSRGQSSGALAGAAGAPSVVIITELP